MIEERIYDFGSFELVFDEGMDKEVWDAIEFYNLVVFTHSWMDPDTLPHPVLWKGGLQPDMGILLGAHYTGVIQGIHPEERRIYGQGPLCLLGDANDRGAMFLADDGKQIETLNFWYQNYIGEIIAEAGIYPGDQNFPAGDLGHFIRMGQTMRFMLNKLVRDLHEIEYAITPQMKLDIGTQAEIFVDTPTTIVLPKGLIDQGNFNSLGAEAMGIERDVEDYVVSWHVKGEAGAIKSSEPAPQYLLLPGEAGDNASYTDPNPTDGTSFFLAVYLAMDDWTPAANQVIVGKWIATASNNRAWALRADAGGGWTFWWSTNGTTTPSASIATTAGGFVDGQPRWIGVRFDGNAPLSGGLWNCKFYRSADGRFWSQLGTTQVGAATSSIYTGSTAPITVGTVDNDVGGATWGRLAGKVFEVRVHDNIPEPGFSMEPPNDGDDCASLVTFWDSRKFVPGAATVSGVESVAGGTVTINKNAGGSDQARIVGGVPRFYSTNGGHLMRRAATDAEDVAEAGSTQAQASSNAKRAAKVRSQITLQTSTYDVDGSVIVGDNLYVYDPFRGLVDPANPVEYGSGTIYPIVRRVHGRRQGIRRGWGVYLMYWDQVAYQQKILDLTPYVDWEYDWTELDVGAVGRVVNV